MKHVTIAASPSQHSPDDTTSHELDALGNRAFAPKRRRLHAGGDGYLTPTFEDYEMHRMKEIGSAVPSNNSSQHHLPHTPTTPTGPQRPSLGAFRHSANVSINSLSERLLERLHWSERIRHYTWTFFTMTMATGGIANVLWAGAKRSHLHRVHDC